MQILSIEIFRNNLIKARKKLNISQIELAEKIGMTQSDISYLESKAMKFDHRYIYYLLSNGISWEWLFDIKNNDYSLNSEKLKTTKEDNIEYINNSKMNLKIELEKSNAKIEALENILQKILDKIEIKMK